MTKHNLPIRVKQQNESFDVNEWRREGIDMKKVVKFFGIAALVAVMVFTAACDTPTSATGGGETAVTVTGVTISPSTPSAAKGGTEQFTATVAGTNSPAQTVTWTIETADKHADTKIDTAGKLTVAAGETKNPLTIRATSTVDTGKYGEVSVAVYTPIADARLLGKWKKQSAPDYVTFAADHLFFEGDTPPANPLSVFYLTYTMSDWTWTASEFSYYSYGFGSRNETGYKVTGTVEIDDTKTTSQFIPTALYVAYIDEDTISIKMMVNNRPGYDYCYEGLYDLDEPVQYTVTFTANGGSPAPDAATVNAGGKVAEPAAMTRSGYTFDGWYKEATFVN
jgi:hypothetical protein